MVNIAKLTYAFIGAGNMSGAILGGMVKNGMPADNIIATNRSEDKQTALKQAYNITTELNNEMAIKQADVIILGLKPQMMVSLLQNLVQQGCHFDNKLIITVAAGLHVQKYKDVLGNVRIIRAMPNTPSLVGLGLTGLYSGSDKNTFNDTIIEQDKFIANSVFESVGKTIWLEQESQIDDISAVSGSGPAYFFLFMQYMMEKAEQLGFDQQHAKNMVMQTALGSAQMAAQSELSFETLRLNVTSPGGSTAEAIKSFEQDKLNHSVYDALDAAIARAKEMSKL